MKMVCDLLFRGFWPYGLLVWIAIAAGVLQVTLLIVSAANGHPLKCEQYVPVWNGKAVTQHCVRYVEVQP